LEQNLHRTTCLHEFIK